MKQFLLVFLISLSFSNAYTQNATICFYAGLLGSRLTGDEDRILEGNARFVRRFAFQGSIALTCPLNDRFKIHTGIGYAQRGSQIESQDVFAFPVSGFYYNKVKIDYLEFPVLISLGNEFMYLMAGPQLAVIVHSDVRGIKSEDVGIKYGAGFELGRYVTAQLLLYHGLTNLTGSSEVKMYNRYMSLAIGAKLFRFRSQESTGNKKSKNKKEFEVPHRTLE